MFAKVFTPLSNGEGEAVLAHGAGVGLLVWGYPQKGRYPNGHRPPLYAAIHFA